VPSRALAACVLLFMMTPAARPAGEPVAADSRLVVERFAAAPDIVHPIATDFDARGRLLVVESHTHFRPADYKGPKHDRVRVLEDTDGDGKADRFTTFFEGTTATMDLAVHPDGAVFVATRNEILRLRDTDGDGTADERTRVVFLDTKGNYPHNGLSGLSFGPRGDLVFGLGENLGEKYALAGSDGTTLTGGGEGGGVFTCTADGRGLRRIATGFWNPFGSGRDAFGRLFVVDNDPDSSPPCRLLHVVEGGDYGYHFRYGRAGRHPFQAWNGELPGTLPMAAGTGESPCEVIAYESDGLPAEYRGDLLVPAWADHRVERYAVKPRGASFAAERKPFVQGGKEFRPSGLAVAPDGSLFVTDWVSRNYPLHGQGAVWHIRAKDAKPRPRPADPRQAIDSPHRPARDAAARTLARDDTGRAFLRGKLAATDSRVRASSLAALLDAGDPRTDLGTLAKSDAEPGLREAAVRALAARGDDVSMFFDVKQSAAVRAEAVTGLRGGDALVALLADADPFLRHAAVRRLAALPEVLDRADPRTLTDPRQRAGVLLARRAAGRPIGDALDDPDPDVRLLAAKWVADERLSAQRPKAAAAMQSPGLDPRGFLGLATALARLDDRPVNEDGLATYFLDRLADRSAPAEARRMALKAIPAGHKQLRTDLLLGMLREGDAATAVEALRALKDRADPKSAAAVREAARDTARPPAVRAQAVLTLAALPKPDAVALLDLATGPDAVVAEEALRSLVGQTLTPAQQDKLKASAAGRPAAARLLGGRFHAGRPAATDTEAWLARLEGPADAAAGRRVFEHPALANCAGCHRVDGRGANVGPDLSLIGRTERRWVVESILQPGAVVAPHYQAWTVERTDGRLLTGLLVGTHLDESVYVDANGKTFKVEARDVAGVTPATASVMPEGLLDRLTDQEVRDLVAFLASRR
jgi:putative membrane-bound dehydrogenase-like protein